jgi:hypothetical protein
MVEYGRKDVILVLLSDTLNLLLCVLSFFLSAISVVTVVITLRQNSRMIENATRPYLTIYCGITDVHAVQVYLVLRNYGQSGALITDFQCSVDLSKCSLIEGGPIPFQHIVGHTIAPNQVVHFPVNHLRLKALGNSPIFQFKYTANGKTYSETVTLNLSAHDDVLFVHAGKEISDTAVISRVLHEMLVNGL